MSEAMKPAWERFGDRMVDVAGYALLAIATILGVLGGPRDITEPADTAWRLTTLAIAAVAAAWIYVLYTRMPPPRRADHVRILVFFVGILILAAILMLRQPSFFIFMISGFFYASILRPLPLAFVGVGATSILVNTLIVGLPQSPEAWTFYLSIIVIQTVVIGVSVVAGEKIAEQNEERRQAIAKLEAATIENAGLHAQLLTQAREAGVLDERQRMAREIHDTIAQGLIGIVTQLEAADQARDRPEDRDRHLSNAERLARESLTEARRSVEASVPTALEAGTLPDALADVAREWSEINAVPVAVAVTGDVIGLHPEIEVALLRIAQEALANVARHAGASRAWLTLSYMGDVVTLDVRDDGMGFRVDEPGSGDGAGFGLNGMRQRVARVAGSLAIESEPGGGTAVSARVPAIVAGTSVVAAP
jgi:signal transduction histidine kinase